MLLSGGHTTAIAYFKGGGRLEQMSSQQHGPAIGGNSRLGGSAHVPADRG